MYISVSPGFVIDEHVPFLEPPSWINWKKKCQDGFCRPIKLSICNSDLTRLFTKLSAAPPAPPPYQLPHISCTTSKAFLALSSVANTSVTFSNPTNPSVPLSHILSISSNLSILAAPNNSSGATFPLPIFPTSSIRILSRSLSSSISASSLSIYALAAAPGASLLNSATRVDSYSNCAYNSRNLAAKRES